MDTRTKEAVRYLGYGRQAIDEPTLALVQASFEELDEIAEKKFVYRIFELTNSDAKKIESKSLSKNLYKCEEVILMAVTLGAEVDRRLRKYEITNIAKAAVFQACSAAYLEEYCDHIQEELALEMLHEGKYLRPRFSPGYGDFSISHQKEFLQCLDASKKIGLTMTESYMLTPVKSVTAVIGVSKTNAQCHKSGCESCDKTDCLYRRS